MAALLRRPYDRRRRPNHGLQRKRGQTALAPRPRRPAGATLIHITGGVFMTRPISLEEIDERLRSLDESLLVGPEDSRALGRIIELHIPAAPTQQRAPARANRRWVVRLGAIAATIAIAILLN